jgi:D-serine deaminase-like pyridoxal phosphate-dependent protein
VASSTWDEDERYDTYRRALAGRGLPAAFVDRDALGRNVERVLGRARDRPVRIATKSVRSVGVLRDLMTRSERFQGLMCYTAPEAVHLAGLGLDDLLVAYPTVDEVAIGAVAEAVGDGARITLMVDDHAHVELIEAVAASRGVRIGLCLELDLSRDLPGGTRFGAWRSPIAGTNEAVAVARRIDRSRHVFLDGMMGYEAQIAGLPDRAPGQGLQGLVVRTLKRTDIHRIAELRAEVVGALEEAGLELRFVNAGGTGSLETSANERVVTEVTVGSGFYSPALFDHYDAFQHAPAAGYAVPVVRRPADGVYTCMGGGYTASGVPGPDKAPVIWLPAGAELTSTEGAGEVQTPVRYDGPVELGLGDPVIMRHAKAGELCERFGALLVIEGGAVVDEHPTYRGDGLTFL